MGTPPRSEQLPPEAGRPGDREGDPAQKIEDIENVETVFKDGIGYDSAKLIESVRGIAGDR